MLVVHSNRPTSSVMPNEGLAPARMRPEPKAKPAGEQGNMGHNPAIDAHA